MFKLDVRHLWQQEPRAYYPHPSSRLSTVTSTTEIWPRHLQGLICNSYIQSCFFCVCEAFALCIHSLHTKTILLFFLFLSQQYTNNKKESTCRRLTPLNPTAYLLWELTTAYRDENYSDRHRFDRKSANSQHRDGIFEKFICITKHLFLLWVPMPPNRSR